MKGFFIRLCLCLCMSHQMAQAQTAPPSQNEPLAPLALQPSAGAQTTVPGKTDTPPFGIWPAPEAPRVLLRLSAFLSAGESQPIRGGIKWRVYEQTPDATGNRKMVAQSTEATPQFQLPEGSYFIHAAYGLAGATRPVVLSGRLVNETVILNAGALKVIGMIGDTAGPTAKIGIGVAIYIPERGNSEAKLVLPKGKANEIICLPEGAYHIVSTLYDLGGSTGGTPIATNSVVTADLRVPAGKIVAATLKHKVATITLKLVNASGGEALANTNFSVLTPGGDVIRELIGAFPSLLLAEGEYVVIARQESETYQAQFKVQGGADRDVEVVTKK